MALRLARAIDATLRSVEKRKAKHTPQTDHADAKTLAVLTATLQKLNVIINERAPRPPGRLTGTRAQLERRIHSFVAGGAAEKIS